MSTTKGTTKAAGYCGRCGTALRAQSRFCPSCGSPTGPAPGGAGGTGARWGPWTAISVVVVLVAVVVLVVNRGGDGAEVGSPEREEGVDDLDCSTPCEITGTIDFHHPTWGPSTLVTMGPIEGGTDYLMSVINEEGEVAWDHRFGQAWEALAPNNPATDSTGHLFIDFNPGRYNGIIVLEREEDGFEDFDTLPDYGDYKTRFYYADAYDEDDDGVLDVEVSENDCDPSCAEAAITSELYRWDGSDYVLD